VPTDRCPESRDDRRSPLHRDLIVSLEVKLKAEVPASVSSPWRKPMSMDTAKELAGRFELTATR
jgi:hypothetical protein